MPYSSLFQKYGNNFGLESFFIFFCNIQTSHKYDRIYLAAIFIKTFLKLKYQKA